jgi:hypothetical protein
MKIVSRKINNKLIEIYIHIILYIFNLINIFRRSSIVLFYFIIIFFSNINNILIFEQKQPQQIKTNQKQK